jgi:hypothetical protein
MDSNKFQILLNFYQSKKDLLELKKIKIKYDCDGFEEMNKFLHRNISKFEMDVKWKFREIFRFRKVGMLHFIPSHLLQNQFEMLNRNNK